MSDKICEICAKHEAKEFKVKKENVLKAYHILRKYDGSQAEVRSMGIILQTLFPEAFEEEKNNTVECEGITINIGGDSIHCNDCNSVLKKEKKESELWTLLRKMVFVASQGTKSPKDIVDDYIPHIINLVKKKVSEIRLNDIEDDLEGVVNDYLEGM